MRPARRWATRRVTWQVDRRIVSKAQVRGVHFHVLRGRVPTALPRRDGIASRVDGDKADRRGERPGECTLESCGTASVEALPRQQVRQVTGRDHPRCKLRVRAAFRSGHMGRGAQRDDPRDEIRPRAREGLGQHPSAAVADDRHPLATVSGDCRQPLLQALALLLGASGIDADPGPVRSVPPRAQPPAQQLQRGIGEPEARDQQDRPSVSARRPTSQQRSCEPAGSPVRVPNSRAEASSATATGRVTYVRVDGASR